MNAVPPVAQIDAGRVYRRLLRVRAPAPRHVPRSASSAWRCSRPPVRASPGCVQNFVDLRHSSRKDPDVLWLVPLGAPLLFLLRGIGDYMSIYFPGLCRPADHQGDARATCSASTCICPRVLRPRSRRARCCRGSPTTSSRSPRPRPTPSASLIRDSLTIIGLLGSLFYLNCEAGAVRGDPARRRCRWLIREVTNSFRRYSARIQNSMGDVTRVTKEALDGQRVIKVFNAQEQEAREFEAVNEHNRRSNMKLIAAQGDQQSGGAVHRLAGPRRHPVDGAASR